MGTIASTRVYRNNPPLNTGEGLTILRNNQIALRELLGSLPPATITSVSSNTITPTSTMLIINVDATINTITSTVNLSGETTTDNAQAEQEFHDGAVIKIIATSGKTVTIGNSGNVQLLNNASSVTVSSTTPTVLTYNASTHKWVEHERVSELIGGVVGNLSNLTTTAKNTVVAAINEVDSNTNTNATNHTTLLNAVGDITKSGNNISAISSQITRTSIIAAINDIVSKIGLPLSGLTTSVKSSIVAAINSLVSGKANKTEVGTLTDLTTTAKTSAVAAINELKSTYDTEIGDLTNLSTTNKDSVVSAINELNTGVVHTSGDEAVAGNKTFSGTVDLTRTTDAGGTSTNKPALRIGSLSGKHLEFDGDEIMAKNTGNTVGQLNINLDGGLVKIGNGGLTVTGTITGNVTGDLTGTASNATNDIDGNAIKTTYAKLASPTFTGTPKAPTASASTNNTQIATTAFVKTAISNLVSSAPTTLDTLNEIATALGNDPNFATTMATQLGLKANDADVVHKTGNEEIAGQKSFSSNVLLKHTSIDHTANPASDSYRGLYFVDKNDTSLARIMYYKNASGMTGLSIGLKANNGESYLTGLSISATTDGEVRAVISSSPALNDSSTKIATTSWIRSATGNTTLNAATATDLASGSVLSIDKGGTGSSTKNFVDLSSAQEISGVKTFSSTIAGSINGNAATATKATQDEDGNAIKTTYAKLASPTFTGTPKAPTASASTNNTQIATTAFVKTAISNLVNSAPTTLDTLNEIATALGNDPNFATTMTTQLGLKANDADVVHKTGDETIAGWKTFSNNTTISKSSPILSLQMLNLDTTQVSTSYKYYSAIGFCDKNGIDIKNRTGMIRSGISNLDSNFVEICAVNPTENSIAESHIGIHYSRDGKAKAVAPSTLTADDVVNSSLYIANTDIVTRDFIPKDTRIVHTTGNEEIDGIKTFKRDIYLIDTSPSIIARVSNTVKGTIPSSAITNVVSWYDGSGTIANSTRYGGMSSALYNSGSVSTKLLVFKNEADSGAYAELSVNYPLNDSAYGTAPSTPQTGRTTDIITRDYLDYHKVEKTAWSIVPIFSVTLNEAVKATQSSPKQYETTDFGEGYKELFIQLYHATAQPAAANIRYRVIFTDNNSVLGQVNTAISKSADTYTSIRAVNDNGLAFTMAGAAAGNPNRFAWNSLSGEDGAPSFCNVDATIKTFRFWSITSAVTQLPAGLKITIWGRK